MKSVLITGTSRGIGYATMQEFLNNGWRVIGTSTTGKSSFSHENYSLFKLDLMESNNIDSFIVEMNKIDAKLDLLINNAATGTDRGKHRTFGVNVTDLQRLLLVNVINTINLTENLIDQMNKDSKIINISSEYGSLTEDWGYVAPEYRITKAAINMYTRNLYKDSRIVVKNIKVYSFDPGWVKTDMGGPDAPGDPIDTAKDLYRLATSDKPSGCFYRGVEKREW